MDDREKRKLSRSIKIAAFTLASASLAFVASQYVFDNVEDVDDIFEGSSGVSETKKRWHEYNRENHPDKINLTGENLLEHMEGYYRIKELYERKLREFND